MTPDEHLPAERDPAGTPVAPDDVLGGGDDLGDALGGLDLGSILSAATEMQQHLAEAQHEAASTLIEGVAGGDAVRIIVTGAGEFQSVHIERSAVDPDDVDMLQDLVLAALHDATRQVAELQAQSLGGSGFGDLNDLLGGGGLGDLFGGPSGSEG